MQAFKDCLNDAGPGHLRTTGSLFTWTNKSPENLIQKRLDRMLCNKEWFNLFTDCFVLVKPKGLMDHNPLLFTAPMHLEKINKPFQFYNFMCDIEGFQEVVKNAWSES